MAWEKIQICTQFFFEICQIFLTAETDSWTIYASRRLFPNTTFRYPVPNSETALNVREKLPSYKKLIQFCSANESLQSQPEEHQLGKKIALLWRSFRIECSLLNDSRPILIRWEARLFFSRTVHDTTETCGAPLYSSNGIP